MAAIPSKNVQMFEERSALWSAVSIPVSLVPEKKKKRRAVREDESVVARRKAEKIEGTF